MFDNLSNKLTGSLRKIKGNSKLTIRNIKDTLQEVRHALIEADVSLEVVDTFIKSVQTKAQGQQVEIGLTPSQSFTKLVQNELTTMMGGFNESLNLRCQPPAIILLSGLQGAGKTTTVAKLANLLKKDNKKVSVVSADIYRPAAIEQLKILSEQINVNFITSNINQKPVAIIKSAIKHAKQNFSDILIIDTAGRLHIDDAMMNEIAAIHKVAKPIETLFVVDSMTGQDATNAAKAFNATLPLTGLILTKTDGDARGGAALSVRQITGKPIKFIGVGEKIDDLESFHPDRIASRILGMGDVLSLVEDIEKKIDKTKAQKIAKKIKKGKKFTLIDFKEQLEQMQNMGGMTAMLDKLPGIANMTNQVKEKVNDNEFSKMLVMINSMTKKEKQFPDLIKGSRKRRVCDGSGTHIQDLNKMLKQFKQMQKMMKKMKGNKINQMMRGLGGMNASKMPPNILR